MDDWNWKESASKQWDDMAPVWKQRSEQMWETGSRKDIIPFISKQLGSGKSVLDLGCGNGYGSYLLHQAGFHVQAIDLSAEMIQLAKQQFHALPIHFSQGDAAAPPFGNQSFDAIMAINTLEWTENPLQVIRECHRMLKDSGLLIIGLLGPTAGPRTNSYPRLYGKASICHTIMPWELQRLCQENGFTYDTGFGVYKAAVNQAETENLPLQLRQALSFMWVFSMRKEGEPSNG